MVFLQSSAKVALVSNLAPSESSALVVVKFACPQVRDPLQSVQRPDSVSAVSGSHPVA